MRGRLIPAEDLRLFCSIHDLESLLGRLRTTDYGPMIQSALALTPGIEGVEKGLRENLACTFRQISRLPSGFTRRFVDILTGLWENRCLKSLIRGVIGQVGAREILSASLPAGRMDEAALRELARQERVEEVIALLRLWRHPSARILKKAWDSESSPHESHRLEQAIDGHYFSRSLTFLKGDRRGGDLEFFLRCEIDTINLLRILRLFHTGHAGQEPYLVPGGHLRTPVLLRDILNRDSLPSALEALGERSLGKALRAALPLYERTARLSLMETAGRRWLAKEAVRAGRRDPLGIGTALSYLLE
jgi:vacuolar-type H+-ATPase subunit C/Vma6